MPRILTESQVAQYHRDGFASPIRVISEEEAIAVRREIEDFEARQGKPLTGVQKTKAYLLFPSLYRIASSKNVLDAIEDVIGPDILLYQMGAWFKDPGRAYVSWHQDATYFGMDPLKLVTAWIALSPATVEMGCIEVLPASHKLGQLPVDYSEVKPENLLSSGQNTLIDLKAYKPVPMPLAPGEISLHHCAAVHSSGPNHGTVRRVGLSMAFLPTDVRQTSRAKATAMLMRGVDKYGHYELEDTPPVSTDDPATVERHARAVKMYRDKTMECGNETTWLRK